MNIHKYYVQYIIMIEIVPQIPKILIICLAGQLKGPQLTVAHR